MSDEKVCRRKTSRSRSPPPPSFLPGYELPSRLRLALRLRGGDAESGIATAGEHVDKMSGCARRRSVYTTIATCRAHPAARRAATASTRLPFGCTATPSATARPSPPPRPAGRSCQGVPAQPDNVHDGRSCRMCALTRACLAPALAGAPTRRCRIGSGRVGCRGCRGCWVGWCRGCRVRSGMPGMSGRVGLVRGAVAWTSQVGRGASAWRYRRRRRRRPLTGRALRGGGSGSASARVVGRSRRVAPSRSASQMSTTARARTRVSNPATVCVTAVGATSGTSTTRFLATRSWRTVKSRARRRRRGSSTLKPSRSACPRRHAQQRRQRM
jgi:hypothetical protein